MHDVDMFFGLRATIRDLERRVQELEHQRNQWRLEQEDVLDRMSKAYHRLRMQARRAELNGHGSEPGTDADRASEAILERKGFPGGTAGRYR